MPHSPKGSYTDLMEIGNTTTLFWMYAAYKSIIVTQSHCAELIAPLPCLYLTGAGQCAPHVFIITTTQHEAACQLRSFYCWLLQKNFNNTLIDKKEWELLVNFVCLNWLHFQINVDSMCILIGSKYFTQG